MLLILNFLHQLCYLDNKMSSINPIVVIFVSLLINVNAEWLSNRTVMQIIIGYILFLIYSIFIVISFTNYIIFFIFDFVKFFLGSFISFNLLLTGYLIIHDYLIENYIFIIFMPMPLYCLFLLRNNLEVFLPQPGTLIT